MAQEMNYLESMAYTAAAPAMNDSESLEYTTTIILSQSAKDAVNVAAISGYVMGGATIIGLVVALLYVLVQRKSKSSPEQS